MNTMNQAAFFGTVIVAGLLLAVPARADRVSVGVGVGSGGSFFALGINGGGRGPARHPGRFHHHGRPMPHPHSFGYLPPPVIFALPPVMMAPAPVVVAPRGYWREREERVWLEGCWVEAVDAYGRRCKQWQPGRWEIRRTREWVE
ncbi:MAG: hypothetical protein GX748_03085 [Lentisphaerae bacterium]|jgi:hypothetical protein|nr:hypothetical protein [Kiritimatiellia bacterium]NLC80148.1 hypothetical protein [Lentisphaerota bacterium]